MFKSKAERIKEKVKRWYFVTPGVEPTLQDLQRFRLLITLLFPVFGNPKIHSHQSNTYTHTTKFVSLKA